MNEWALLAIAMVFPISFFGYSYISKSVRKKRIIDQIGLYIDRIDEGLSSNKDALDLFRRWKYWLSISANSEVYREIDTAKPIGTSAKICLYTAVSHLRSTLLGRCPESTLIMLSEIDECLDSLTYE